MATLIASQCNTCNLNLRNTGTICFKILSDGNVCEKSASLLHHLCVSSTKKELGIRIFKVFVIDKRMLLVILFRLVDYLILITQFDNLAKKQKTQIGRIYKSINNINNTLNNTI